MATVTIELPDDQIEALNVLATAEGVSAEQYAKRLLEENIRDREKPVVKPTRRAISEVIEEIMADASPKDVESLPEDGASQHDHYLYGWPKRSV